MLNRILGATLALTLVGGITLIAATPKAQADDESYQALPYLVGETVGINLDSDVNEHIDGNAGEVFGRVSDHDNPVGDIVGGIAGTILGGAIDNQVGFDENEGFDDQGEDYDEDGGSNITDSILRDAILGRHRGYYNRGYYNGGYYNDGNRESIGDGILRSVLGQRVNGEFVQHERDNERDSDRDDNNDD